MLTEPRHISRLLGCDDARCALARYVIESLLSAHETSHILAPPVTVDLLVFSNLR